MNFHLEETDGAKTAVMEGEEVIVASVADALDLLAVVKFEGHCDGVRLRRRHLSPDFFILSTGLAGEILQKWTNYRLRVAIQGDFTGYTSKPLQDFIRECNRDGGMVTFIQESEG